MNKQNPTSLSMQNDPAKRLLQISWNMGLERSASGVPTLLPEFVAEQGRSVRLFDLRSDEELLGFLGHIPGVVRITPAQLHLLAQVFPHDTPIVMISGKGERAGKAALYLEMLGMHYAASMHGGMQEWKRMGFAVSRHPRVLTRVFSVDNPEVGREILNEMQTRTKAGEKLKGTDVEQHLGDPANVRWIRLASLLTYGKRSCVDGRDDKGVIGMPGGDAGEFLLSLAAIEQVTGKQIDVKKLPALLYNYIDTFGRFYMHSDTDCANAMIKSMRQDSRLASNIPMMERAEEWRAYFSSPPPELREAILEHLIRPEHIGCGHIRLMMLHEDKYKVRRELVEHFLRAFHHLRWEGVTDIDFVILGGSHDEGAVVNVHVAEKVEPFTKLPLISPSCGHGQMFINHPEVSAYMRHQTALFMMRQKSFLPIEDQHQEAYLAAIQKLAGDQTMATLGALAKNLPLYEVCFQAERMFTVEYQGDI